MVGVQPDGITLTQISQALDLNVSTCHHLVATLLKKNYLDQDPSSKRYLLGPKLLQLKNIAIESSDMYSRALPILQQLNEESTETVHLAVLRNDELITLFRLESLNTVKVGQTFTSKSDALHCTATGKAIVAFLPREEADRLFAIHGLKRFTPKTITDRDALEAELAKVREQGFALDLEEFTVGVSCVGAPIRDYTGKVIGAFSVSTPTFRTDYSRMQELIGMVLRTTEQISRRLGHGS